MLSLLKNVWIAGPVHAFVPKALSNRRYPLLFKILTNRFVKEGAMADAVTSATWDQEVLKASGLVLVDFWAVWCGPCRMVAPIVDEISKEYTGKLKVLKLNTDENPDVAGKYRIMGIPTLMFFKNGQTVDQVVGAVPKSQLKTKVDALLTK